MKIPDVSLSARIASAGSQTRFVLAVLALLVLCQGCDSGAAPVASPAPAAPAAAPAPPQDAPALEPAPVAKKIVEVERVEDLTETAANRLIEFSDAVRLRRPDAAALYLTDDFLGTPWSALREAAKKPQPLSAEKTEFTVAADAKPVGRSEFLAGLFTLLEPLAAIDYVFFKTRGAEFEADGSRGTVTMTANVIGTANDGRAWSLYAWTHGEVRLVDGLWRWSRCVIEKAQILAAPAPPFVDVATSAGMDVVGPRLGGKGNDNFYWRGAATADVDGDGLYDVFTSTHERNYLWRNKGDGTFEDATARFRLDKIAARVTGPLFFDHDGDGDLDLFAGRVGWEEDGTPRGDALGFYRNDGAAGFVDVTKDVGLDRRLIAMTACAADVDRNGRLDVFVCGYNRLDAVYPNSWFAATNGTPNALFMGLPDGRFEDRAAAAGVAGKDWTYAAAFADYDEDGDEDLFVANDYGVKNFFKNRGDGTFEDVAKSNGTTDVGNGMGCAFGDLDDDGRLDVYVSNMSSSAGNRILKRFAKQDRSVVEGTMFKMAAGNTILMQKPDKNFEVLAAAAGGIGASWAWGPALFDCELDGDLDVYVSIGFISGNSLKDT
jgi:hypothetical protein